MASRINPMQQIAHRRRRPLATAPVVRMPARMVRSRRDAVGGLTRAATKAQWPLMMTTTWVYAVLAIALAANAVVAVSAISKLEEPHGPRPR
jgi:hypothetical protein